MQAQGTVSGCWAWLPRSPRAGRIWGVSPGYRSQRDPSFGPWKELSPLFHESMGRDIISFTHFKNEAPSNLEVLPYSHSELGQVGGRVGYKKNILKYLLWPRQGASVYPHAAVVPPYPGGGGAPKTPRGCLNPIHVFFSYTHIPIIKLNV